MRRLLSTAPAASAAGTGPNARGLSRRHVQHAVEASLRRLGVNEIDLLYLHKEDHSTPLAETVHALADLIRAGKIRYFGVSNYRSWRVAEICRLCDAAGIDRLTLSDHVVFGEDLDAYGDPAKEASSAAHSRPAPTASGSTPSPPSPT